MSEEVGANTPVGLTYRYFDNVYWKTDPTLQIADISNRHRLTRLVKNPWVGAVATAATAAAAATVRWVVPILTTQK